MPRPESTQAAILAALADGKPKTHRELVQATGLSGAAVWNALARAWRDGLVMRTEKPTYEAVKLFRGRAGMSKTTRAFHKYLLAPSGKKQVRIGNLEFVAFSKRYLDARGGGVKSKAKLILEFLQKHADKAWYSKDVVEALKKHGVNPVDVMPNMRRFEWKGLIYVRGYRTDSRQTSFTQGYLLTWIDLDKPREQALAEAVERTNQALAGKISTSPIIERMHIICDLIIEATKLRELTSAGFLRQKLACNDNETEQAIGRALQLYPDLKEVKLFDAHRYFYHDSMDEADLRAAVKMKENYIRMTKGQANRIGHNWEACVEWFVDKFTYGAHF